MIDSHRRLMEAVSFAARAHRHQVRKDGQTPYHAHPMRVCLTIRHVFGVHDEDVLIAALLHDTIEDTTTDFDDIAKRFGEPVAQWVGCLTKDSRLPEDLREDVYLKAVMAAGWQVQLCKLADIYDNLMDAAHLTAEQRQRTIAKSRRYLEGLRRAATAETVDAVALVESAVSALS